MAIKHGGRGPGHLSRWPKAAGTPAFDPASLFGSGEAGGFWVASEAHTWADTAGTTPITDNTAAARVDDLSGNGNHIIQATGAVQPVWKANGGLPYCQHTAQSLTRAFAANFTGSAASVFFAGRYDTGADGLGRMVSLASGAGDYNNLSSIIFLYVNSGSPKALYNSVSGPTITLSADTDVVVLSALDATNLTIQADAAASSSSAHGLSPALNASHFSIGAQAPDTAQLLTGRFYGALLIDRALTPTEIADCVTYFGVLQGRTL